MKKTFHEWEKQFKHDADWFWYWWSEASDCWPSTFPSEMSSQDWYAQFIIWLSKGKPPINSPSYFDE